MDRQEWDEKASLRQTGSVGHRPKRRARGPRRRLAVTNPIAPQAVRETRLTIGLDVGDRKTHLCVLDHTTGEILEEGSFKTSEPVLRKRLGGYECARIALETGGHARWMAQALVELGHEVLVANARKLRLITDNDTKSDRLDAMRLALLARADPRLLHAVRQRGKQAQADLAVVRAREVLVATRTKAINHARGVLKSFGLRPQKCSSSAFAKSAEAVLPEELAPALTPLLEQIRSLTKAIKGYDKRVEELCEENYPETRFLRQVKGVGCLTALAYVLSIEDPTRFSSGRKISSYLGLRPRRHQSGAPEAERKDLPITKAGNPMLRKLLVTSAHYVLGPFGEDSDLRSWGLALAERRGKKRAVVAVARKLGVLLYTLWLNEEPYQPLLNSKRQAESVVVTA